MKINILISFLLFIFSSNAYSKEVNLSCDLSKFFTRKYMTSDEQQIPLSKVDPMYLGKVSILFDMENKKFLSSNLIYPIEYKSVLFADTRLNRTTGELTRVTRVTESVVKDRLKKKKDDAYWGWKQTQVYQCKVVDKLF
jgi:hypothetical protein